jgi:hypothetical protein
MIYLKPNRLITLCTVLFFFSCGGPGKKDGLDKIRYVPVEPTAKIFKPDELLSMHNYDKSNYDRTYKDSSIFVEGYIRRLDKEHGEVLFDHNIPGNDFICLMKDSTDLQTLRKFDKVLFKGKCKPVGSENLILIINCEMAQIISTPSNPG